VPVQKAGPRVKNPIGKRIELHSATSVSQRKSSWVTADCQCCSHLFRVASNPRTFKDLEYQSLWLVLIYWCVVYPGGSQAYCLTASSSLEPGVLFSYILPWSHLSRTNMEPRFVPCWYLYRKMSLSVGEDGSFAVVAMLSVGVHHRVVCTEPICMYHQDDLIYSTKKMRGNECRLGNHHVNRQIDYKLVARL
jgi:hypothetical protein